MKSLAIVVCCLILSGCVRYDEGLPIRKGSVSSKIIENWNLVHYVRHGFDMIDERGWDKFGIPCDGANGRADARWLSKDYSWSFNANGTWKAINKYHYTANVYVGYENGNCIWEPVAYDGERDYEGTWTVDDDKEKIIINGLPSQGEVTFDIVKLTRKEVKLICLNPSVTMRFEKRQ